MSATPPIVIRRELLNVRGYFIPQGDLVDGITVAAEAASGQGWPDNAPTSNYTAYEFVQIENAKSVNTVVNEVFKIPNPAGGGYVDDEEQMVTKRSWEMESHATNSYFKKLENGLASLPVAGTAQAIGQNLDNYIDGVALLVYTTKGSTVVERRQVWARLRLKAAPDVGPATGKVAFSLEMRPSTQNSYLLVA